VAGIAAGITSLFQAAIGETMTYRDAHGSSTTPTPSRSPSSRAALVERVKRMAQRAGAR